MPDEEGVGLLGLDDSRAARQHHFQLYSSEFVPHELRRPWITGSYRASPLQLRACLYSVLRPTNETLNVWSHLVALAVFALRSLDGRGFAGSRADRQLEVLLLGAAQACFAMSAAFHLLNTVSLRAYRILHKCDIAGILVLVLACYLAGLQLGFGCAPHWAWRYQAAIVCSSAALAWCLVRGERVPRAAALGMTLLVVAAIWPIAHWASLMASNEELAMFGPRLGRFFALLAVGLGFFATGLPERCAPGRFDVWGHSHTWWHVFVMLAIASFHTSLEEYSHWRHASLDLCIIRLP
ncbi:hemolysin-III related-domain-containing protein [Pavlovales sp. CCMP2436]|nr:hemolysin-III related-domain-containing protein [Pavlovales sp. CCMP2436]|mmetsp:Transcript_4996/g.12935  ORF Transcript_4996/g.12935 Transcript_4996/m.12935 type:complete len:295 (+) Transcript_4996:50-934(+)